MRREVGKGGIVGLAVVHQDFALATNAEVLFALGGVRHSDEGDVGAGESLGGLTRREWKLALPFNPKIASAFELYHHKTYTQALT